MEGSAAAPPQRVCPKCARISWATGPECPYCRARFRRYVPVTRRMLVLALLALLVGVGGLLAVGGIVLERRIDDRIEAIDQDFDRTLDEFRDEVRAELDARLPAAGTPIETPFPTASPAPIETVTPAPTPAPTETPASP